jgi:hypothetical protein
MPVSVCAAVVHWSEMQVEHFCLLSYCRSIPVLVKLAAAAAAAAEVISLPSQ